MMQTKENDTERQGREKGRERETEQNRVRRIKKVMERKERGRVKRGALNNLCRGARAGKSIEIRPG